MYRILTFIYVPLHPYPSIYLINQKKSDSIGDKVIFSRSVGLNQNLRWGMACIQILAAPYLAKEYAMISINPLPHMPILGSSNSAPNKDMISKI